MEPRQSEDAPQVGRQLSTSEWRVLHCVYSLAEGPDLITAVTLRDRFALPPYNRNMRLNHVQVLLVRIEAAGYITSTPIPRGTGERGRMEYSYRPRHAYEVVFDQLARSFLESLVIGSDRRAKAILRRLLEEEETAADQLSPEQGTEVGSK